VALVPIRAAIGGEGLAGVGDAGVEARRRAGQRETGACNAQQGQVCGRAVSRDREPAARHRGGRYLHIGPGA